MAGHRQHKQKDQAEGMGNPDHQNYMRPPRGQAAKKVARTPKGGRRQPQADETQARGQRRRNRHRDRLVAVG